MAENDLVKRLMWSATLAGVRLVLTVVTERLAAFIWRRVFDEDPPD